MFRRGRFFVLPVVGVLLILITAVLSACTPQQTIRGTERPGASSAAGGGLAGGGDAGGANGGGITSVTVQPEAGVSTGAAGGAGGVLDAGLPSGGATGAGGVGGTTPGAMGFPTFADGSSPFSDIQFDFDSSLLRDDAKPVLVKISEHMKKNSRARLLIEGHCDSRGTDQYNMALGERRAESARSFLAALGVSSKMLATVSFGKERPADPADTEEAYARNRRAHFVVK